MTQKRKDFSRVAAEALEAFRLCREDSNGDIVYNDAGEFPLGVNNMYTRSGDHVNLKPLFFPGETFLVELSGAVTKGDKLYAAADGKLSATINGLCLATAFETGVDAQVIEVIPVQDFKGLLYANVAASAVLVGDGTEQTFDKSFSIPANFLKAGDLLRIRGQVIAVDNNGSDTLTLKLKIGSQVIVATAAVDAADGDIGYFECLLLVRTAGSSGTFVASGVQGLGIPATVTAFPFLLGSTALDTTAAKVISVSATWSGAHADNETRLDMLTVEKVA